MYFSTDLTPGNMHNFYFSYIHTTHKEGKRKKADRKEEREGGKEGRCQSQQVTSDSFPLSFLK